MYYYFYDFFLMIHIMHVLRIGSICVAKEKFPLRSVELDNKGILLFYYLFIYYKGLLI